jgi:hypothetical protein
VAALNQAYEKQTWWKTMMDDPDLHLGIRKDYLNIYYAGNSLIKLEHKHDHLLGKTHYKFLLDPYQNLYIQSSDGKANPNNTDFQSLFIKHLYELKKIKRASLYYAGEEKKGIQKILMSNPNIIDMEIAMTQEAEKQEAEGIEELEESAGPAAQRLDFAALQKVTDGIELVFFEAKIFSNKELRATGEQEPRVVKQIKKYQKLIEKYAANGEIAKSYKRICENFVELLGIPDEKKKIAQKVLQEDVSFSISTHPRLVIFGFDQDQKIGEIFNFQKNKLEEMLGKKHILLKGNPKDFTNNISFT